MKRLKRQFSTVLVGFLIAIVLSLWAIVERNRADDMAHKAKATEQKATHGLFDSTVTHASLLTQIEDYADAREKLNGIRQYDNEVEAPRLHARDLLAGFVDIMGGEAQATFTDSDGRPLPLLVGNVAFSPDGRWLAASGERGTIALFERVSGQLVQKLAAHEGYVWDIVFHPVQPWLISAGSDGQIIRWQLPEASQPAHILQQWHVDAGEAKALALHPDGSVLASGHDGGVIRLWAINAADPLDASSGEDDKPQLMQVLEGHKNSIANRGLAFSPDGQLLASASYDKTVRVWDWQDEAAEPHSLRGHSKFVTGITFSPSGERLVSSSADDSILLWQWNTHSWDKAKTFKGHQNMVFGLRFLDDALLASASFDKSIRLWDVQTGTTRRILQGHTAGVIGLATWNEDGRTLLYSASNDGSVKQWAGDLPGQWLVDLMKKPVSNAIHPSGNMVAVGLDDGDLRFYALHHEVSIPALLQQIEDAHSSEIKRMAFNGGGSLLATAGMDGTVKVWAVQFDAESQELTLSLDKTFDDHSDVVHDVVFSPDGSWLATASYGGRIGLFSLIGKEPLLFEAHRGQVASVSFDASGEQLVSGGAQDFKIKLWNLDAEPPAAQTIATRGLIAWSSFSPNGAHVATVGRNQDIRIDSVQGQNEPLHLYGHESTVYKAIFSQDSRQLATVSADMTVRLWDLDTQSELFRLRLPDDWVVSSQRPSALWDFDFRCTPTGCWIAVPLTSGKLALYNLGKVNYESTH